MNPGRVISHAELMQVVWRDTAVGPDVLKVRIARVRRLLGDDANSPSFIASVHGEGYRFLPQRDDPAEAAAAAGVRASWAPVGRERELDILHHAFCDAIDGRRQIVFVTGEAGIGKTTLIDCFVNRLEEQYHGDRVVVGRGQCIQHYGSGEPYLPVMEALSRLARDQRGRVKAALHRCAPLWLLQLPALLDAGEHEALRRRVFAPTPERMPRELAEALEAVDAAPVAGPPLVIVLMLEDLQWADVSTLDLLHMLAHRREPARLLVLGSYRVDEPGEEGRPRPLVRERHTRAPVGELALGPLRSVDVARFFDQQFPGHAFPADLAATIHRRTNGNPLFLADILRDLRTRDVIVRTPAAWAFQGEVAAIEGMIPASIRHLAARQWDTLTAEERHVLEAASAVGLEFSAAAVAAALAAEPTDVEERLVRLARDRQCLRVVGTEDWPDGTHSMLFSFTHALYRELWQERVGQGRKAGWHVRVAERKETAYGTRAPEIAAELAAHFEHGRDYGRAVLHREQASRLAMTRAAGAEALIHLRSAFDLLAKLPNTRDRLRLELRLRIGLGTVSSVTEGYASRDAAAAFERAHEICLQLGDAPELLESAFGLCRFFWIRGDLARARELGEHMQSLVLGGTDPVRTMAARLAHGSVLAMHGSLEEAVRLLKGGLQLARAHWRDALAGVYGPDLDIVCGGTLANVLQISGYPDQAFAHIQEALRIGTERSSPMAEMSSLFGALRFHHFRGDADRVLQCAERARQIGTEYQLGEFLPFADAHYGWAAGVDGRVDEGLALVRGSVETLRRVGADLYLPYVLFLLVETTRRTGRVDEARRQLHDAIGIATRNGGDVHLAELYRLDGELRLESGEEAAREAETCFERAIEIARRQQARSWELRAVLNLARFWSRTTGKRHHARELVSSTCRKFTEGFDSPDWRAAAAFLNE